MKDSTKKLMRNNLEKECKEINFINYNNSVYIYPSSLKTEEVNFKKYQKQADEAVKLKDKLVSKNDPLSSCGKIIREEISNMKDKLPSPQQPDDRTPDKFEITANLSYSLLKEAETKNAFEIYEQQLKNDSIIPKKCKKDTLTIFVADNIDRNEEILSGE